MNLLLIEAAELGDGAGDGAVELRLDGRRAEHIRRVLRAAPGDSLRLGLIGGGRATARIAALDRQRVSLRLEPAQARRLRCEAPRPAVDLVVGMPRPAVLHRVLQHAAAIGVGRLDLVAAWRVEKSYFQSPSVEPEAIHRHLLLGLEQGAGTFLPAVELHRLFVPFVERLPETGDERRLLAHPRANQPVEDAFGVDEGDAHRRVRLAIGPEGGWIDRELDSLADRGFVPVTLGPFILRSEAALTAALAQVALLRRLASRSAKLAS